MSQKLTIKEMHNLAKKKQGKCLSKKYIGGHTKLKWMCSKEHVWKATPFSIMHAETWCPVCSGNIILTIKEMHQMAKERGGKCLSNKYINARTKLKWMCSKGHIWKTAADKIRRGHWCQRCSARDGAQKRNRKLLN